MGKKNKKLLIAGGGYADIPLIHAAQKLGFYVITSGNLPEQLGHRYSDEYYPADFSDPDAILNVAKRLNITAICACCNDFSALSASYTAEKLGLPGHDSYEISQIIHHKDLFRRFSQENAIPSPRALGFKSKHEALKGVEQLPMPCIVKPVDLTGGKGITKVRTLDEAMSAVDKAFNISRTKRIVIEEFIEGTRHGFSTFLYNGKVIFHFSDNEHYYLNPYMVSAASTPSTVPENIERILCSVTEKISSLLSLKNGIFHIQYILRDNDPVIIEICRRAPGDLYITFVQHATGVDYPEWIVKASAGMDCSQFHQSKPKGFFTRHCIMSKGPGRIRNLHIDSSIINNIIDKFLWWKTDEEIIDFMTSKFGIVFLQFDSMEEMLKKTENLNELIKIETY